MSKLSDRLILMRVVVFDIEGVSSSTAKHVIRVIEDFDGGKGCFASVAAISLSTGLSKSSVKTAIRLLLDAGFIRSDHRGGVKCRTGGSPTNRYFVDWKAIEKLAPEGSVIDHSEGAAVDHSGGDEGSATDHEGSTTDPMRGQPLTHEGSATDHRNARETQYETQRNIGGVFSPTSPKPINDPDAIQKCLDQVEAQWKATAGRQSGRGAGLTSLRFLLQNRQVTNPDDWFLPAEAAFEYAKSDVGRGQFCMALTRFCKGEWQEDPETWQESNGRAKNPVNTDDFVWECDKETETPK